MDKLRHVDYWLIAAEKDKEMMNFLSESRRYVYAIFFGHLFLEKIAKAVWVYSNTGNIPPKTHNLLKLISESNVVIPFEYQNFLLKLNKYQIESRYPEDIDSLYRITDKEITQEYINTILIIEKCLREKMQ